MKILVDADACPKQVLQLCLSLGKKQGVPVWTVASFNHNIQGDNHVVVGNGPQEADIKLANLTGRLDVVVTQDWGLAAVVLGKGALGLSPLGREYTAENIEFLLEEREVKAKFRRGGGRTKGPSKRTEHDDNRFENCLKELLIRVMKKAQNP